MLLPFSQLPFSVVHMQAFAQGSPLNPGMHLHNPWSQVPKSPQSTLHALLAQCSPVHPALHMHVPRFVSVAAAVAFLAVMEEVGATHLPWASQALSHL
jgi:hypothetical protein